MNKICRTKLFSGAETTQDRKGSLDKEELHRISSNFTAHQGPFSTSSRVVDSSRIKQSTMTSIDVKGFREHTECPRGYRGGKIAYLSIVTTVVTSRFYLTGNEHFIRVNSTFIQWLEDKRTTVIANILHLTSRTRAIESCHHVLAKVTAN